MSIHKADISVDLPWLFFSLVMDTCQNLRPHWTDSIHFARSEFLKAAEFMWRAKSGLVESIGQFVSGLGTIVRLWLIGTKWAAGKAEP